ncbi:MAG: hypothetical protein CM1200mP13_00830 [Candidatus Pelagibacterales bacterium]|nr:MAG: hypothetical protein CM1200mP13_00830 [Pelagibacterales bacterium]
MKVLKAYMLKGFLTNGNRYIANWNSSTNLKFKMSVVTNDAGSIVGLTRWGMQFIYQVLNGL